MGGRGGRGRKECGGGEGQEGGGRVNKMKDTQQHASSGQPLRERLKHPSLSPASESAPHCSTTAFGR